MANNIKTLVEGSEPSITPIPGLIIEHRQEEGFYFQGRRWTISGKGNLEETLDFCERRDCEMHTLDEAAGARFYLRGTDNSDQYQITRTFIAYSPKNHLEGLPDEKDPKKRRCTAIVFDAPSWLLKKIVAKELGEKEEGYIMLGLDEDIPKWIIEQNSKSRINRSFDIPNTHDIAYDLKIAEDHEDQQKAWRILSALTPYHSLNHANYLKRRGYSKLMIMFDPCTVMSFGCMEPGVMKIRRVGLGGKDRYGENTIYLNDYLHLKGHTRGKGGEDPP